MTLPQLTDTPSFDIANGEINVSEFENITRRIKYMQRDGIQREQVELRLS